MFLQFTSIRIVYILSNWSKVPGGKDPYKETYEATITYKADANYTFAMTYTGNSGNAADAPVYAKGTQAPEDFTIDTVAPERAEIKIVERVWSKFLSVITFGLYTNTKADVTIENPKDATSEVAISYFKTNDPVALTKEDLDKKTFIAYEPFTVKANEQFIVYAKLTDKAGNYTYINSDGVIVDAIDNSLNYIDNSQSNSQSYCVIKIDTTAPVIEVSYDNNSADSGTYFKANRTATVKITERNFNSKDVKITITNTDGVIPALTPWKTEKGTLNNDNTVNTATIVYSADGDYTFDISYTDLAGLDAKGVDYGSSVAPKAFTVDKTAPKVSVSYSNNNSVNGNYYSAGRIATIVIDEHNFNMNRVDIDLSASNDGTGISAPAVSTWSTSGDRHTATINYSSDALYSFDIAFRDLAGNESTDYKADSFYIDNTDPSLEISNIENNSANGDVVQPVVTYSDTNIADCKITLSGANRGSVAPIGSYTDIHNGRMFSFADFVREAKIDDIYTLTATVTDKAGRTTTKNINFSVNRFGSVYALSDATKTLNGSFVKEEKDVVISEVNANELSGIEVRIFKNGEEIVLKKDVDYKIDIKGGNGAWYEYTYTVFAKNFADDGVYRVTVYSEDAAGNIAENTLDTKETEINFGVDKTAPTINMKTLESGVTYALDNIEALFAAADNLKLVKLTVTLDGTQCASWTDEALDTILETGDDFMFAVDGNSTEAHHVKILAVDAAGNEFTEEITDFFVTTNLWVRYYNNKAAFYGSIAAAIAITGLIVFLVVWKRRKEEKKA